MRGKSHFSLLVAIAAVTVSCATNGARTLPMTVELFDDRSPGAPRHEGPDSVAGMDVPKIPGAESEGAKRNDIIEQAAFETAVSASDEARRPPALNLDASFTLPVAPRTESPSPFGVAVSLERKSLSSMNYRLALPEAPAIPIAQSTVKTQKTATGSRTTSLSDSSAPVQASGAAGSSGTAGTPGTGGSASARVREIFARLGDELQIGLEGQGYLFLGFPQTSTQTEGMSFKDKETRGSKTYFTFKALKFGVYDLSFLKQDNSAGSSTRETVRVHVVPDDQFTAAVERQDGEGASPAGDVTSTGSVSYAEKLAGMGEYRAAIDELLKGYLEGDAGLNDRLAHLYLAVGDLEAAEKYYGKNLSSAGQYVESAVLGMVRVAIAKRDQKALVSRLGSFFEIRGLDIGNELMQAARFEKAIAQTGVGLELLSEYVKRYPSGPWRDEVDFLTAQFLEADSRFRDLARARELYKGILGSYPESPFAAEARDRLNYIERHFFTVR